ncbi:hypothetical protein Misp01_33120 [Microtetraspora sp. NBRC 13810]|nr:hypothetical protein Misp01_33120 [Microtetraspora sp. NBRC 13810]
MNHVPDGSSDGHEDVDADGLRAGPEKHADSGGGRLAVAALAAQTPVTHRAATKGRGSAAYLRRQARVSRSS